MVIGVTVSSMKGITVSSSAMPDGKSCGIGRIKEL